MQQRKFRLDFVVAGVLLLLLFSLLPFLFQQQIGPAAPTAPTELASNLEDLQQNDQFTGPTAKDPLLEVKKKPEQHHEKPAHKSTEQNMDPIIVQKASDFDETLKNYFEDKDDSETVLVYLYGNVQAATGKSWCPDCAAADVPIRTAAKKAGIRLIEAPVGERNEYKGVPHNPYRVHPQIKLVSVPTIIKWTKAGPGDRLVEHECRTEEAVSAFLED